MYLSKVQISPKKSGNPYELHRALWQLLPGRPDEGRSFLFRVESLSRRTGAQVLMQSEFAPVTHSEDARCQASKSVNYRFKQGQQLRFRLRSNPVKAIKDTRKGTITRNGKTYVRSVRVPLVREEDQKEWLVKKLEQAGAQLQMVNVIQEAPLHFRKHQQKNSGKVQPVLFDGILVITEPQLFLQAIKQGVGPAKSFGMGLLSLSVT